MRKSQQSDTMKHSSTRECAAEKKKQEEQIRTMRWGILATGSIANKFARTLQGMKEEGEILEAVASRNLKKAEAFAEEYGAAKAYDSYEKMAMDPQVEAIYIATPNSMHFENTKMCLEHGKHVLCEKPFTIKKEEAEMLYALAQEKGLFLMEAFWIRFLPALMRMQEWIREGAIGEVVHMRSDYGFITAGTRKDRKFDSSLGGGALLDIGIYNLGFAHMVMGEAPVNFSSRVHINEYGTDDFSTILLEYPGGKTAALTTSIGMEMPRQAAIFGTKGSITLPDFQQAQEVTLHIYGGETITEKFPFDVNGFEYQIREVRKGAANGQSASEIFKPTDSLLVLGLMDDIRESWNMKFSCEE